MQAAQNGHNRIAIIRLSSLGDVIHTLPLAAAIRQHDPAARVIWLAEEREQVLLQGNPAVDEVVTIPVRRWRNQLEAAGGISQSARELRDLARRLRSLQIDIAIDVQGWAHKTSPLAWLTRAPQRIGFGWRHARHSLSALFTTRRITPPASVRHIVDQNLALLEPLGIRPVGGARFPLPAFSEADARAEQWCQVRRIGSGDRLVVVLPSTRGPAKRWPAESFQELTRRLLYDPTVKVAALGGPGEEELLAEVARDLPRERVFTWAPGPIPDLVAVLRRAHLAIGNDTGPLHVASVSNVPAIGLFGPTRGERNGPYGAHGTFIQSRTGRIKDIGVDEVFDIARRSLNGGR